MTNPNELAPPKNQAIDVASNVIHALVDGLGVDLAVAAGISAWPFLGSFIIKSLFRWGVEQVASVIETDLDAIAIKLIIRIQSTARKKEFNEAMTPIIAGSPTSEEIQKARAAADALIERNRA